MLKNFFKRKVEGLSELPTLPESVEKIVEKIDSEGSMTSISEIIEEDQVISARVLRLVNSAFYGIGGRISSLHHAVSVLGINVLRGLVISSYFLTIDDTGIEGLWEHASAVSAVVYKMGKQLGFDKIEEISSAALLHDIGKLVIREVLPDKFSELINFLNENKNETFALAEKKFFPVGHEDAALMWMKRYNFPLLIQEVAAYHHRPSVAGVFKKEVSLVHLADLTVRAYDYGFSGDFGIDKMSKIVLKHLNLKTENLYDLIYNSLEVLE